jgi:hypothetical protein
MTRTVGDTFKRNLVVVLILLALGVAYFWLRTPATPLASVQEFDAMTQAGQPALVEFYSNI